MFNWSHGRPVANRLVHVFAFSALCAGTAAAQEHTCWLRDGVSPAPSLVYMLCEQGQLVVTTDNGVTWATRDTGVKGHLRTIDFIDTNHGFAVGDGGLLLATDDGGKSWQTRKTGLTENLAAVQFVGQSGWAAGFDGVILHSADGGKNWAPQDSGTKESLESIFFLDKDHGWAVGWAGTILRTENGGAKWQPVTSAAAQWSLSAVYFRDVKNGWIVGFGGQILRSKDGGVTWEAQKSPVGSWLSSVAFDKANRGWITADDSLLMSTDGGESWKVTPVEDKLFLSQLVPVGDALWAIGQLGALKQNGAAWKRIETLVTDDPAGDSATSTKTAAAANH